MRIGPIEIRLIREEKDAPKEWNVKGVMLPEHIITVEMDHKTLEEFARTYRFVRYHTRDRTVVFDPDGTLVFWARRDKP